MNIEPEVEFRPELEFQQEMDIPAENYEGGLGASRPITDIASQYITTDKPEVTVTCIGQEVTTCFPIQNTQTAPAHTSTPQKYP